MPADRSDVDLVLHVLVDVFAVVIRCDGADDAGGGVKAAEVVGGALGGGGCNGVLVASVLVRTKRTQDL